MYLIIVCSLMVSGEINNCRVAQVDFSSLKPLLMELAFSKSSDSSLMKDYKEFRDEGKQIGKQLIEMAKKGESGNFATKHNHQKRNEESKRYDEIALNELIRLVKKHFDDKYSVIFDSKSYSKPLLYTSTEIIDITVEIRQLLAIQK